MAQPAVSIFVSSVAALCLVSVATVAHAQEPEPPPRGCTLGAHHGIDDIDAQTSADVVCHELASHGDLRPREVRMGRLGGRIIVTVSSPDGAQENKRLMVNSLEEIPTAATRLAEAASARRPIEETQSVDNVVGGESRNVKMKSGQIGVEGGLMGALPAIGASTSAAPGAALGVLYRAGRVGLDAQVRGGGGGGSTTTLTHFAGSLGARYYFTDGDFAPYAGGGLAVLSYKLAHDRDSRSLSNTGLGGYVELGLEALRTHRTALTVSVRADVPMFELTPRANTYAYNLDPATGRGTYERPRSQYIVPASLMVGVLFH